MTTVSATTSINIIRSDAARLPFAEGSFDLVFGSPPYVDCRTYGIGADRNPFEWVDWMLAVTAECLRASSGAVIWVAAGATRDRTYWPACEGLMWRWWSEGWGERGAGTYKHGSAYRPCYWHRVGIPGSGGDQWYRADVEYVMCFKRPGALAWAEPTANGVPPRWAPGGAMSYRSKDGSRKAKGEARRLAVANGAGKTMSPRDSSHWSKTDDRKSWNYVPPDIANPGNVLRTDVGGGRIGHDLAHESEAPFPEALPQFFLRSHCPPGGIVLDPFGGSGTTAAAALLEGRNAISSDIRHSQGLLARRRIGPIPERYGIRDNPSLALKRPPISPLPGQLDLGLGFDAATEGPSR